MTPVFTAKDMINLGMKEFYIKMTIDGDTYDPFSAESLAVLPPSHESNKQRVIEASRKKYAMPIEVVKQKIKEEEMAIFGGEDKRISGKQEKAPEPIL